MVFPSLWLQVALLVGLPIATLRRRASLRQAVGEVPASVWWTLAAVLTIEVVLVTAWVPHGTWQTNMHGFGRIADVLDEPLLGDSNMGRIHGMAWVVLMRLVHLGTGGLATVPVVTHAVALTALLGLFFFLTAATRRPTLAVTAVALLALHPMHLRLAASCSPYVLSEAGLLWVLAWVEVHRQDREAASWWMAAGWQAVLMQSHGEMLVLGPGIAGLYLTCRSPDWWWWAVRRPGFWLGLAGLGVVVGPWLGDMLHAAFTGVNVYDVQEDLGGAVLRDDRRTARLWQVFGGAGAALWMGVVLRRLVGRLPVVWEGWSALGVAVAVLAVAALCVPDPGPDWVGFSGGRVSPLGPGLLPLARIHPFFDPTFSPAAWVPLAVVGAGWLAVRSAAIGMFLAGSLVAGLVVTVGQYDAISTYVRISLPTTWMWVVLAGCGLWALLQAVRAEALAGPLAVLMALGAGASHWSWVGHRFPMQQEEAILQALRAQPGVQRVATLLASDAPSDRRGLDFEYRFYVEQALGRWAQGRLIDASTLLETPLQEGTYWLELATCRRPVMPGPELRDKAGEVWWVGDRFMQVVGGDASGPDSGPLALTPESQRGIDLDALVPCRDRPGSMRCHVEGPGGCEVWACADDQPPSRPYRDAWCERVHERFLLEPVHVEALAEGNLSRRQAEVAAPGEEIGLYRVVGVRGAP